MKLSDISIALKKSGIKKSDTLMIHGNAGIAAQLNVKKKIQLDSFFNQIIKYIGKQGNLLIPAFTYSFCKTRKFNVQKTKSEVGLFSENLVF